MPPFTVTAPKPPAPPASGGHYVRLGGGNQFQLIHAIGPNRWAPGPPAPKAATHINAQPGGIPANSPLLNPNQQLSGKALLQAGQGLVNAQTQGPLSELAKQIAANEAQSQDAIDKTGGYFHDLGQQTQQGVNQVQGIGAGLNQQLSDIGTQEQSQLQGIGQNATTNFQRYAPQSDAANSLGQPGMQALATEIARQQGLAAQDQGAFRAFGATQGANYGSLAASNLGTFGLKGQEALKGIAQAGQLKNEPLMAKVAALQATRGSDLATALGRLRQQEITNQISRTGLGIKQQAVNAALQNAQTNRINAQTNIGKLGATIRGQDLAHGDRLAALAQSNLNNLRTTQTSAANNAATNSTRQLISQMGAQAKAGKVATPQQTQTVVGHIDYLRGQIQQLVSNGISPVDAYHLIQNGGRIQTGTNAAGRPTYRTIAANRWGPQFLNAAYNVRSGGTGLSPGDVAWLHSLGIRNTSQFGPVNTTGTNISEGGLNSPH